MELDKLLRTKGIFTAIDNIKPLPFNNLVTPEEIDLVHLYKFGNRILNSKTADQVNETSPEMVVDNLAHFFITMYYDKWVKLYNGLNIDLPLNITSRETFDELITVNNESKDNVSAYDSDELVTESGNTTTNNNHHTYTKDKISYDDLQRNIELLQDNLIHDIMFTDVNNNILLLVN